MHYLFILGRNIELSKAEIFAYLEKEYNKVLSSTINGNGMLLEVLNPLPKGMINNLGGSIAIGEVSAKGTSKSIVKELSKKTLYMGKSNKLNYVLWDFCTQKSLDEIRTFLKEKFREESLKATEKTLGNFIESQNDETFKNISSKKLIDEQYFLYEDKELYFGKITERSDYEEIEKRDMNKPFRRSNLAISPRLAKIMINLSLSKPGNRIIDPFCGIGVILQEALLQNFKVVGLDTDKEAIKQAHANLEWAKFNKNNYSVSVGDSRQFNFPEAYTMVSEPDLGETLRKEPRDHEIKPILEEYESLMINVLNNVKRKVSGRFVFTAPLMLKKTKRISCDIDKIIGKTHLKLISSFQDYRKTQLVGRSIFVLEK